MLDTTVPDLLHVQPIPPRDADQVRLAVGLAFVGGGAGGLFDELLDRAPLAPSTFERGLFEGDLFLSTFVTQCLVPRIEGKDVAVDAKRLARILAAPPSDPAIVQFRRAILEELVTMPALRGDLERLYLLLCRFRATLEGSTGVGRWDANMRQIDLLQIFKDLIDMLAGGFADAQSGLSRLRAFGRRVQEGEPYRSLADLLRYEKNMATLSLKVGVGADGRVHGFEIVSVEAAQNPFVTSTWRRWLVKLEMFVRGYRFDDSEVMARLIDAVFDGVQDDFVALARVMTGVELYLGALGFRDRAMEAGLEVTLPALVPSNAPRVLLGLFNPLLLPTLGRRLVPCDITLEGNETTALITGPNSGGKTRLLQSIGLAQLLAQTGLFVPARSASLALANGMVISIVQETAADQSEGRLGMELVRIRTLFERLKPGSVVILDELCSGTNPSEGEEIFELVVRMLRKLRPHAFLTTHFLAFAAALERERRIEGLHFLQVELGQDREPTYRFAPGVAKTSLAGQTAARLGVTGEALLKLVEQNAAS